jgi:hypothetical protein
MDEDKAPVGISKIFSFIYNTKVLYPIILTTIIAFIFSIFKRFIYIDDAFFGEQAYYLAKEGIVKIPSMLDFLGCENHLLSYHKLNIFIGAGLIKIFGFSLTPLRTISILFTAGLVWVLIKHCRHYPQIYTKQHIAIGLFILLCNPLIVLYAFTYRPEIWLTLFGFISFYFINKTLEENAPIYNTIFAGIFAGLAFLTHLNGLIFPVAGFVSLLFFKKYKLLVWYVISGCIIGILYFWDLWQGNNMQLWLYQLKNWPDNNATSYMSASILDFIKNVLLKLSNEHQRFFWSDKVWGVSSIFLLCLIFNFRYLYKNHKLLIIYTLTLILTLNIAGGQIAERFLIYFIPFFALIISISIVRVIELKMNVLNAILIILLFLQLSFVFNMFSFIYNKRGNFVAFQTEILNKIKDKKALVLAPYQFVFNGVETNHLASFKSFEYHEVLIKKTFTQEAFFKRADSLNIKYIIIPRKVNDFFYFTIPCLDQLTIDKNPYYSEFINDSKTIILKSRKLTD